MKTLRLPVVWLPLLMLVLCSCNTQAPKTSTADKASFDPIPDAKGNQLNSGVLGIYEHRYIITPTARQRYNLLMEKWGAKLYPPLTNTDAGLELCGTNILWQYGQSNLWLMDKYHFNQWATMNRWQNNPPPKPSPP